MSPAPKLKILVVDDSPMDRRLAQGLLDKHPNVAAKTAAGGTDALTQLGTDMPDIVVTDLHMPDMSGLQLVDAIRRRHPHLPVILMTAHGSEDTAVQALQHGAASYVPKRNLATELFRTIQTVLEVSRGDRDLQQVLEWRVFAENHFEVPNDTTNLPMLIGYLEALASRAKLCDETGLIQLGVALREALVNAMIHGNFEVSSKLLEEGDGSAFHREIEARRHQAPYKDRRVIFQVRHTPESVRYIIRDQGPGFDPRSLPDPTDLSNLDRVHGRGLLLIRTFMDSVEHNESGNEITMIKHRTEPAPSSEKSVPRA